MATLLGLGAVPVINENDTVATDEIRFGDNDRLGARVAEMISADTLVLLSDIDGLYTGDPRSDASATFIPEIREITPAIEAMAGAAASELSNGGMVTKLMAGRIAMAAGCRMAIADGRGVGALGALIDGTARCSWFLPEASPLSARKKWIKGSLKTSGALIVDDGAVRALSAGKSLLPAGVTVGRRRVPPRRRGRREGPRRPRAGARPGRLCRRRRPPHRRPQERRDRAAAGLPRPRRDGPSRRPRGRVKRRYTGASDERPDQARRRRRLPSWPSSAAARRLPLRRCATRSTDAKNRALLDAARLIRAEKAAILAANARDIEAAKAAGMTTRAAGPPAAERRAHRGDGQGPRRHRRPARSGGRRASRNGSGPTGSRISRVRVPIGIIGVIYEARPNVTADAGALCIKSGNVVVLRGGSDSFHSSRAIVELLRRALAGAGLPEDCVQLVPTTDRAAVGEMLRAMDWLDLIVPRGGRSLIDRVTRGKPRAGAAPL